jgi:wyosine [tRNA(Phe)-imidazoG37] synthetase (radical SAM superfamily)
MGEEVTHLLIYSLGGELVSEGKKYLYGPVPSRRLGLSLGVDIVPLKVCTLDCIYCQLGRSSQKTLTRKIYAPLQDVLSELKGRIESGLRADYITIGGSGEPTLHSQLGELIEAIKDVSRIPVAVLTNGTLFYEPAVRADCSRADVVLPSLDAGDEQTFNRINRPHNCIRLEQLVEGLCAFRAEYSGAVWLEVFLVEGINTETREVDKIAGLIRRIRPDKVQLNTAVRPGTEPGVSAVRPERLEAIASQLVGALKANAGTDEPRPQVEVIADFASVRHAKPAATTSENLAAMLKRRPCSLDDICRAAGLSRQEALKQLTALRQNGAVRREKINRKVFYRAVQ